MIKTMAMFSAHTIHVLHVAVRDFFIALAILVAALFLWLVHGIEIDKIDIRKYQIEGLYIKLDKKLTLKAKQITLPRQKASPSFGRVDKTFDRIKNLLRFFDSIMLKKINFENNHFTLFYIDNVLYVTSDDYEIAALVERRGEKIIANVPLLYLKKDHIYISGQLNYDFRHNQLDTNGKFDAFGIKGQFRAIQKGDEVVYAINTDTFSTPAPLIKRLKLNPAIESWIVQKVLAKQYKVEYLKGRIFIEGDRVIVDAAGLKGRIRFDDVSIRYHEKVPPAHAKRLVLRYKKGNLYFDLEEPIYEGRDLNGTSVVIKHIVGAQSPVLTLNLQARTPIDAKVSEILHAYGLHIPVSHTGKDNRVTVALKIPLGKHDKKIKAVVDAAVGKGRLRVEEFTFYTVGGEIHYESEHVSLKNIKIKEKWYRGVVEGDIDLSDREASLVLKTDRFTLGNTKDKFLTIKKKHIPLQLSYADGMMLKFPSLKTEVMKKEGSLKIVFSDLQAIKPYLRGYLSDIEGGRLKIESSDMELFRFKGTIFKSNCIFYDGSGLCYSRIPIEGVWKRHTGEADIYAFEKRFHANTLKRRIWLNGINIDLKRFLSEQNKRQRNNRQKLTGKRFVIIGTNSHLRYGNYRLVTDSYDIEVFSNGDIKAIGSIDGDVMKFTKKGKNFFLKAFRVKDKMLHPLINFSGLKKGRYSLKKEGNPDTEMKGRIIIEGGILSDFKAYSNILAFINTIPALATLHSPGFSSKGFKIKEGVIEYRMTPKKITFDSVYLKGNSATVLGKGEVDLVTKRINMKLAILTVREFGEIVSKIPLLGYILMGEDNSVTVGLTVTGTLNSPKVAISVAKDILTLPIEILKRTITAPAQLGKMREAGSNISSEKGKESMWKKRKSDRKVTPPTRSAVPSADPSGQLF